MAKIKKAQKSGRILRVAVYDSFDRVIGYKADSLWNCSTNPLNAKKHTVQIMQCTANASPRGVLYILNEVRFLNGFMEENPTRFDDKHSLSVVAEDYKTGKEVARHRFQVGQDGRYVHVR